MRDAAARELEAMMNPTIPNESADDLAELADKADRAWAEAGREEPERAATSSQPIPLEAQARPTAEGSPEWRAIEERKGGAGRELSGLARAIEAGAKTLAEQDQRVIADYAKRAAQKVSELGQEIDGKSVREIGSELERVCRQNPLLAGGLSVLAGFVGSRLLRGEPRTDAQGELELASSDLSRAQGTHAGGEGI